MTLPAVVDKALLNPRVGLYLLRLLNESRMSSEQVRELQFRRLKRLLNFASTNFDFYRDRFRRSGFDPLDFTSITQLEQIPVLTKDEYREFTLALRSSKPASYNGWYEDATSGSTGTALSVWRTWDERAYMVAKWMRALRLNGYRWHDRTLSLTNPYRLRKDSALQSLGIMRRHAVSYTEPVGRLVSECLRVRADVLYGIKAGLLDMALHCRQHSIALPHPRFYVSVAEALDSSARRVLVDAFGPGLAEVYGSVEFSTLAWRCPGDEIFRFSHTTNVLEVADDGTTSGRNGSCIVTDLFIRSFPLIRYQLGDQIETDFVDGLRVINRIAGRTNDSIVLRDGTRRSVEHFWAIIKPRPEILRYRVIQESMDLLRLVMVREPGTCAQDSEAAIGEGLRRMTGDDGVRYEFDWVERIPPDPNGKLRALISKVPQ